MNKEELIGKLQMVYVGDKNALNELIGYYDGLKEVIGMVQQENQKLKDRDLIIAAELTKLQDENKQLKDNWNKLKDYIVKEYYIHLPLEASTTSIIILIDKMQELEGGMNEYI